ncbi:zinc metallochaperone AztD [Mycetocola spongiae]|uniref:zinc metallochaperone AztD n=1 Tax=Mycetocola spongiae TaxID=2859226 RepID=UPI001CF45765|nr:zinc metallochaperone AztD [Mycetocola spongiae]UCR88946.1 hypothetical protein KXZ72_13515 [Mycetocola spongiae]
MTINPSFLTGALLLTLGAVALTGCAAGAPAPATGDAHAGHDDNPVNPLVATYDGGVLVLDGESFAVRSDITLDGFNRINPAGDSDHVLVSTASGFRLLDAAHGELSGLEFAAEKPGHAVVHGGKTALFADGSGEITLFNPEDLTSSALPRTEVLRTEAAHHGVAVALENGELMHTIGTEEARSGILVLDSERREITRNEQCPGVHGESAARGDALVVGCTDGVLVYAGGEIRKVSAPDAYGRSGNSAGSHDSAIVLADYKTDEDAELERPERFVLVDTEAAAMRVVDLPAGVSYSFRSLGRGPQGEALILGTDGALHVFDATSGASLATVPVTREWTEPTKWQDPRPTLFVRGSTAYISEPGQKKLHTVDLNTASVTGSATLPHAINELTGVAGHAH